MTLPPFATPPPLLTYPRYPTATSLPGLMARFLVGRERVLQRSTLSVQSVSFLPLSPSPLSSGPPATVLRPMPFFMLLGGVSLTTRHVRLNLSPCFLILYLFCQPSQLFTLLNTQVPLQHQSLFNTLSDSKVIHFQWIPGHSSLPGNGLADSLAKVGASLDPSTISLSLSPLISSQRLPLCTS